MQSKIEKLRGMDRWGQLRDLLLRQIALTKLPEDEALIADGLLTELRISSYTGNDEEVRPSPANVNGDV